MHSEVSNRLSPGPAFSYLQQHQPSVTHAAGVAHPEPFLDAEAMAALLRALAGDRFSRDELDFQPSRGADGWDGGRTERDRFAERRCFG